MLKVGLVGAGFMGQMHTNCYANLPEVKLVGIADKDEKKAAKLAGQVGAKSYSDFDEMLKKADIDMVDVCLPTYMHKDYVIRSARAGMDVLCEKPMAMNLKEASAMQKAVKKAKVKFMVAHCIRFWPEYMYLKEFIDKKKLGGIKSIYLSRLSPTPTWTWKNWILNPKLSGGASLDLHIHDTDYILYLFGKPQSVFSTGTKDYRGWSHIWTSYKYSDVTVVTEGGWDMPAKFPFNMCFRVVFEKGVVDFGLAPKPYFQIYESKKAPYSPKIPAPKINGVQAKGNISSLGGYFNEIKYFTDCVLMGKTPRIVTPEDAAMSLKIIMAEMKSAQTKKPVKL
ncbi:MAG: Gfo/Idh/MocA family oxidoreductase [Candidatus Firestonebacteria bacterium]